MVEKAKGFKMRTRKRLSGSSSPPSSNAASSSASTTTTSRPSMFRSTLGRLSSAVAYTTGIDYGPSIVTSKSMGAEPSNSVASAFDFEKMVAAFEAVTFPSSADACRTSGGLPLTQAFLCAMDEVILLFDDLGSAFAFVRRDISTKTEILRQYSAANPSRFVDLETAVNAEVTAGTADSKPPPSAARTLLRLMWALKFIDVLLGHLREAIKPDSNLPVYERTLRAAVDVAYETALAEHHTWPLRKTVRAALTLLPTMETFINNIGATPQHLSRLENSMTPIVHNMYRFYEKNNLLELS